MTTKEELLRVVDVLDEGATAELLEYARWLWGDGETLSEDELARVRRGEEQLRRGESVSWDELRGELGV